MADNVSVLLDQAFASQIGKLFDGFAVYVAGEEDTGAALEEGRRARA